MSEDSIDIRVLAQTIRRWWLLLLLGPLIAGALAVGFSLVLAQPAVNPEAASEADEPSMYQASTIVSTEGAGQLTGVVELITTKPVLEDTINEVGLSLTVAELRPNVSAVRLNGSSLIRITVLDTDQSAAIEIADGIARSFINYVIAFQEPQLAAAQD